MIPNPWDAVSARLLAGLGFKALATSSAAAAALTEQALRVGFRGVDTANQSFNFMAGIRGKSFSVAELAEAGVRRISLATSMYPRRNEWFAVCGA